MDKKRIIKTVSVVCFVIACGVLYLVCCSPFGKNSGIVFEKGQDVVESEPRAKEGDVSPALQEKTAADSDVKNDEPEKMLYVHICGAVLEEGVYALTVGSRVTDGIKAAGGFREDADAAFHNLAALLTDGQKVYVPTLEETKTLSLPERTEGTESSFSAGDGSSAGKRVNLNTAGLTELMTLEGIGEAKAESILKYREKVGRFQSIEELKKISGIGDAMFERIREDIVVE